MSARPSPLCLLKLSSEHLKIEALDIGFNLSLADDSGSDLASMRYFVLNEG